jgi:hypothetical protein
MEHKNTLKRLLGYLNVAKEPSMIPIFYDNGVGFSNYSDRNTTLYTYIKFTSDLDGLPQQEFVIQDLNFLLGSINLFDEPQYMFEYEDEEPKYLKIKNNKAINRVILGDPSLITKRLKFPNFEYAFEVDLDLELIKDLFKFGSHFKKVYKGFSVKSVNGNVGLVFGKIQNKTSNTSFVKIGTYENPEFDIQYSEFLIETLLNVLSVNKDFKTATLKIHEKILLVTFTHEDFENSYVLFRQINEK